MSRSGQWGLVAAASRVFLSHGARVVTFYPLTHTHTLSLLSRATRDLFDEVGAEGEGDVNAIVALVRDGADVNAKSSRRTHPLFEAAKYGHERAIKTLVKRGADVDAKNGEVGLVEGARPAWWKMWRALLGSLVRSSAHPSLRPAFLHL